MIAYSLSLMVLGMFTVFVFLGLLILAIHLVKLACGDSIEKERLSLSAGKRPNRAAGPAPSGGGLPASVIAAAVCAYEEGL